MSGGNLNYVNYMIEETIELILELSKNPLHIKFANHLEKVKIALHELELTLSGDQSEEDCIEAIENVFKN